MSTVFLNKKSHYYARVEFSCNQNLLELFFDLKSDSLELNLLAQK